MLVEMLKVFVVTFIGCVAAAIFLALIALPVALLYLVAGGLWWLLLYFVTIPLAVTFACALYDWVHNEK